MELLEIPLYYNKEKKKQIYNLMYLKHFKYMQMHAHENNISILLISIRMFGYKLLNSNFG